MTASHRALRFPETSALLKNTHSFIYLLTYLLILFNWPFFLLLFEVKFFLVKMINVNMRGLVYEGAML